MQFQFPIQLLSVLYLHYRTLELTYPTLKFEVWFSSPAVTRYRLQVLTKPRFISRTFLSSFEIYSSYRKNFYCCHISWVHIELAYYLLRSGPSLVEGVRRVSPPFHQLQSQSPTPLPTGPPLRMLISSLRCTWLQHQWCVHVFGLWSNVICIWMIKQIF